MSGVQGLLVGKVLTKADVELCRVVLPRMAMEANMPEVVDAHVLHLVGGPSAHHSLHCCQSAHTVVLTLLCNCDQGILATVIRAS